MVLVTQRGVVFTIPDYHDHENDNHYCDDDHDYSDDDYDNNGLGGTTRCSLYHP